MNENPLEKRQKEERKRAWVLFGIMMLGMLVLCCGLFIIQIVLHTRYTELGQSQSYRKVSIPAMRGEIFDRHGEPLAINLPRYDVTLSIETLHWTRDDEGDNIFNREFSHIKELHKANIIQAERFELGRLARYNAVSNLVSQLEQIISRDIEIEPRSFHEHYSQHLAAPMTITRDLSPDEVARFVEHPDKPLGMEIEVRPYRVYPQNDLAAQTIGYAKRQKDPPMGNYEGRTGLERFYHEKLAGVDGMMTFMVNNFRYRMPEKEVSIVSSIPGQSIYLSLDSHIQRAVEYALTAFRRDTRGAAVVVDADTGDVLALASIPTYDLNSWYPRMSSEFYNSVLMDSVKNPMFNRAMYGKYTPGSIFKIMVGLACLEAGANPMEKIFNPGAYPISDRHDIDDTAPVGDYNFRKAFKWSSNYYFIHHGLKIGLDPIMDMTRRFGLSLPNPNQDNTWYRGDIANLSIGQGSITVSPLNFAMAVAAIANGGTLYRPRILIREKSCDPAVRDSKEWYAPEVVHHLQLNSDHLAVIRDAMLADVEDPDGTGKLAYVSGMQIFGKTGTAETYRNGKKDKNTWFASFGIHGSRKYSVVIVVEGGRSGGDTCAPIARLIYQELMRHDSEKHFGSW